MAISFEKYILSKIKVEAIPDIIINQMIEVGLTHDEMLEVLRLTKEKFHALKNKDNTKSQTKVNRPQQ